MNHKNIIVDDQHGFRESISTEINLLVFYSQLIRSILEFSSVAWNNIVDKLEKLQCRFLRIMEFILGKTNVGLDVITKEFGLDTLLGTLYSRRLFNDVAIMYKMVY